MTSLRFARQETVPDIGARGTEAIHGATVIIVGCGGLGHPASMYLAAAGVGRIILIDEDTIEVTNLHRQVLFTSDKIGESKVDVVASRLREHAPSSEIEAIRGRLGDESINGVLNDLVHEKSPVLDCTDSFASRHAVSDFCRQYGHWHIWGNIFCWEGSVALFDPSSGVAYEDYFDDPPQELRVTCATGGVVGPVCGVVGSFMAAQAMKLIVDARSEFCGQIIEFDLSSGLVTTRGTPDSHAFEADTPSRSNHTPVSACQENTSESKICQNQGLLTVDVREPWESRRHTSANSVNVPIARLWSWLAKRSQDERFVFVCDQGIRAQQAMRIACRMGWAEDDVFASSAEAVYLGDSEE